MVQSCYLAIVTVGHSSRHEPLSVSYFGRRRTLRAVNRHLRMAGDQCPLKGGAIDHHRCHGELVNQLTKELTN